MAKFVEYLWIFFYFIFGVRRLLSGLMTTTGFVLFFSYSKIFSSSFSSIVKLNARLQQIIVSVERVIQLSEIYNPSLGNPNKQQFPVSIETISFEKLCFNYGERYIINSLDETIVRGDCTLLVGPNGAGKTTLLNILSGILPVTEGNIYFNDISISDIDYNSLREAITYATQDDVLFDMTIKENILSFQGGNKISEAELFAACEDRKSVV